MAFSVGHGLEATFGVRVCLHPRWRLRSPSQHFFSPRLFGWIWCGGQRALCSLRCEGGSLALFPVLPKSCRPLGGTLAKLLTIPPGLPPDWEVLKLAFTELSQGDRTGGGGPLGWVCDGGSVFPPQHSTSIQMGAGLNFAQPAPRGVPNSIPDGSPSCLLGFSNLFFFLFSSLECGSQKALDLLLSYI
jgi:hypothetical protein